MIPPPTTPPVVHPEALRVSWHVAGVGGGPTSGDITRALSRAAVKWNGCYEAALRHRGLRIETQGTLHLSCDDRGRVVRPTFTGTGLPDIARCVEQSVTGLTVANADGGDAWGAVTITFALAE